MNKFISTLFSYEITIFVFGVCLGFVAAIFNGFM